MSPSTPALGDLNAQLAQLRDIRLPEPISWWPPAPGWWIVLALTLIGAAFVVVLAARRRRSLRYRALAEIDRVASRHASSTSTLALACELGTLVKRVVVAAPGGRRFAPAHGACWERHLLAPPHGMPEEIARYIASAPYRVEAGVGGAPFAPDRSVLLRAVQDWVRRHA